MQAEAAVLSLFDLRPVVDAAAGLGPVPAPDLLLLLVLVLEVLVCPSLLLRVLNIT